MKNIIRINHQTSWNILSRIRLSINTSKPKLTPTFYINQNVYVIFTVRKQLYSILIPPYEGYTTTVALRLYFNRTFKSQQLLDFLYFILLTQNFIKKNYFGSITFDV